jgi:hypothetical protein
MSREQNDNTEQKQGHAKAEHAIDLISQVFGRLTVVGKRPRSVWLCECRGGEQTPHEPREVYVSSSSLLNNETRSCGCLSRDLATERMSRVGKKYGPMAGARKRAGGRRKGSG